MAQSTKHHWTTPELRQFATPEEAWAFYGKLTGAESELLAEILLWMRSHQSSSLKRTGRGRAR